METTHTQNQKERVAEGIIHITNDGKSSSIKRLYSSYPLRLMNQFLVTNRNDNDCCILYILGYGGGALSGDTTTISCTLDDNCTLCLHTQGATKIYKKHNNMFSNDVITSHTITCCISSNSLLVHLPDHTSLFRDSCYKQKQVYHLHPTEGSLILVDWFSCGRKQQYHSDKSEQWNILQLTCETTLVNAVSNDVIIFDNLHLEPTMHLSVADKVGYADIFGTIVLYGTRTKAVRDRLTVLTHRQTFKDYRHDSQVSHDSRNSYNTSNRGITNGNTNAALPYLFDEPLVSVSHLSNLLTIVKFAHGSIDEAYELVQEILKPINEDINHVPYDDRCRDASKAVNSTISSLRKYDKSITSV